MVSGNPVRTVGGLVNVQNDAEWEKLMPNRDKWVVTALTLPLLVRYGYVPLRLLRAASAHRLST